MGRSAAGKVKGDREQEVNKVQIKIAEENVMKRGWCVFVCRRGEGQGAKEHDTATAV